MRLRTLLTSAFVGVSLAVSFPGWIALRAATATEARTHEISAHSLPRIAALSDLRAAGLRIVSSTAEYTLISVASGLGKYVGDTRSALSNETGLIATAGYAPALQRLAELTSKDETLGEEAQVAAIRAAGDALVAGSHRLILLAGSDASRQFILEAKEDFELLEGTFLAAVGDALASEQRAFAREEAELTAALRRSKRQVVFAAALGFVAALLFGQWLSRRVAQPLVSLAVAAHHVETGDLSAALAGLVPSGRQGRGTRETRRLWAAFSAMAARLRDYRSEVEFQRDSLENEVAARTAELAAARDVAEAANLAKSRFLANMSHELRTPMTGVLGMTELLMSTPLTATQRQQVETVSRAGKALLRILDDILDLSRIEAGRFELVPETFDLRSMLDEVLRFFEGQAAAQRLELRLKWPSEMSPWVEGDETRLRQVLTNLVGNSIKFTPSGSVVLSARPETDQRWRFEVTDTGIGIPAEEHQNLFRAFSQLDSSPSRRQGGMGLGLALSQEIVQRMEGSIDVSSEPGQGSTFSFCVRLPAAAPPQAVLPPHVRDDIVPDATRGRVLIAEDNPINALVTRAFVEKLGFVADVVNNGRDAVQAATRGSYSLVLMDCHMPEMDGFEATARIRRIEAQGRHTPIIALTADAMVGNEERCLSSGMDGYIAKPTTREDLERVLANWCSLPRTESGN